MTTVRKLFMTMENKSPADSVESLRLEQEARIEILERDTENHFTLIEFLNRRVAALEAALHDKAK